MSNIKEIITGMMDMGINYTDEKQVERYNLRQIADNSTMWNDEIASFLQSTVPKRMGKYYLQAGTTKYNIGYDNLNAYIKALSALAEIKTNLYFIPCVFSEWREDADALYKNCLFVDIDNIDIDLKQTDERIIEELKTRFPKIKQMLPCYAVKSGHGLHLYWRLKKIIDMQKHDDYFEWQNATKLLITYFSADVACRNASRIMRLPTSYNCKNGDAIKSKIILKRDDEFDIRHFADLLDGLDFEEYKKRQNEISSKKRKETMLLNGTQAGRKKKDALIQNTETPQTTPPKKKDKEDNTKETEIDNFCIEQSKDYYYNSNQYKIIPHGRASSLLSDLIIWYHNRHGQITGYREHFTMMICNLFMMMGKEKGEAQFFIMQYFKDTDFEDEALEQIDNFFQNRKQPYFYRNETIADLFDYTDAERKDFVCNYTDTDIKTQRKKKDKRYAERKKAKRDVAGKRERQIEYIKQHPEKTQKELALDLNITTRTIRNLKKLTK